MTCILRIKRKSTLYALIFINYFSDLLNGLGAHFMPWLPFAGPSIRGAIVMLGMLLARKAPFRTIYLICFSFLLYSVHHLVQGSDFNLAFELQQMTKIIFPIAFAATLSFFGKGVVINQRLVVTVFSLSGFVLSIGIIGSVLLGVQSETYSEGSFGQKGIMLNQNDMALLLVISILYSSYGALAYGRWFVLNCALGMVAAIILGTRLGLLATLLSPLVASFFFLRSEAAPAVSKIWLFLVVLGGTAAVGMMVFTLVLNDPYLTGKFLLMLDGSAPRGRLFEVGLDIIAGSEVAELFFGRTATEFYRLVQDQGSFFTYHSWGKRVEVDPIDIVGCYGFFIYMIIMAALFRPMLNFLLNTKKVFFGMLAFSLIVILLHSLFLGHVITQPITGAMLGFILFIYSRKDCLSDSIIGS